MGIGRGAVQAQRAPVEPVYNLADADSDLQFRLLSLYRYLARRPLLVVDKIAEVVVHGSRKAEGVWRATSQRERYYSYELRKSGLGIYSTTCTGSCPAQTRMKPPHLPAGIKPSLSPHQHTTLQLLLTGGALWIGE